MLQFDHDIGFGLAQGLGQHPAQGLQLTGLGIKRLVTGDAQVGHAWLGGLFLSTELFDILFAAFTPLIDFFSGHIAAAAISLPETDTGTALDDLQILS